MHWVILAETFFPSFPTKASGGVMYSDLGEISYQDLKPKKKRKQGNSGHLCHGVCVREILDAELKNFFRVV